MWWTFYGYHLGDRMVFLTISSCRAREMLFMTGSEPEPKMGVLQCVSPDTSCDGHLQRAYGREGSAISPRLFLDCCPNTLEE